MTDPEGNTDSVRSTPEPSRRDAILAATVQEVVKRGFDGTSIQRIAAAAGVSHGLVIYHFKTKEELITAAWLASVKRFSMRATSGGGVTGIRRMENTFRFLFPEQDEEEPPWDLWLELWAKASRSAKLRKLHSQKLNELRQNYAKHVKAAMDAGQVRDDLDPELVGDLLQALVYGLATKVALDGKHVSPERAYQVGMLALELLRTEHQSIDDDASDREQEPSAAITIS